MPEDLSAAVRAVVQQLMSERNVSAYAIAKGTGIPQSSLSRKLNGPASFDLDDVQKIAPLLGTDAGAIVSRAQQTGTHPAG